MGILGSMVKTSNPNRMRRLGGIRNKKRQHLRLKEFWANERKKTLYKCSFCRKPVEKIRGCKKLFLKPCENCFPNQYAKYRRIHT